MIEVYDSLIVSADLIALREKYLQQGMLYGWKANKNKSYDQGHWNRNIFGKKTGQLIDVSKLEEFGKHEEVQKIWNLLIENFGNRQLLRCYLNGYTYGTDGYAHTDEIKELSKYREVNFETIIIYLNDDWHIDFAGETVIFNSEKEIERSVLPKFGRILIFNSRMLHSARPLSRICTDLRLVLVFKTWKSYE